MNVRVCVVVMGCLLSACSDEQPPARPVVEVPAASVLPVPSLQPEILPPQAEIAVIKPTPPESISMPPSPEIDLRLPEQLVNQLRFDDPVPVEQGAPLLPPLFVEKPKPERRFQLEGSLHTNQNLLNGGPTVKAIDGAELQLEYKH